MKVVMWVAIGMEVPEEFEEPLKNTESQALTTLGAVMVDRLRQANFLEPEIEDGPEII